MATSLRSQPNPKRMFAAAKNSNNELELLVYDSIGESFWGGGVTAEAVKQKLNEAGDVSKITMRINSPGGDVFEASAIYSVLTQHKADVECYVDGLAASAAFTIAMAGDTIHISESAMMMCHNALGMCFGNGNDMREMAKLLDKVSGTMRDIYSAKSGMKADDVQALMDAETWMTAAEAVEYGFADDVVKRDPKEEETAQALAASWDLSKFKNSAKRFRAGASGSEDWPLSERDHAWSNSAADDRIRKWASSDGSGDKEKIDWAKYQSVHFWYDPKNDKSFAGYKLLFCDVLSSQVTAIWRGVTACAGSVQGSRGGLDIPDSDKAGVKAKIQTYYGKAKKKYDDDSIDVPWKAKADEQSEDNEPAEGDECECPCTECQDDNCAECSNPDCNDPNCEHKDDSEAKAAALAEVERLREEFAVLSI